MHLAKSQQLRNQIDNVQYQLLLFRDFYDTFKVFKDSTRFINNKELSFRYYEEVTVILNKIQQSTFGISYIQEIESIRAKCKEIHKLPYKQEVEQQNEVTVKLLSLLSNILQNINNQIQERNKRNNKSNILLRIKNTLFNILTKK